MSYTPKQQGSGGSGGQSSQQAKALAGITQQMQNLVHGQNALPQAAQAGLGAFANLNMTLQHQQQQQRIESIIREQQLLFSANPQFQQHFQQQMQQNAAKEPLALTRSPAELLNKMQQHHQQQANGSTSANTLASNLTSQQLQQQLQAFSQNPANLMQQIQAYQQYQMQQQNKQKMLSLNQAQQSLTSLQAQQHMQQIQQTLQQQQQKLMATHNKNLSAGNQIKSPTSSNSQASQPVQPNNNLPNKPQNKMSGSSSTQQSKLTNAPQSSSKSAAVPNIKNSGHPLGTPKTATSPQLGNKPIVSPKIHVNATPPAKTSYKPPTPPAKPATITSSLPPKSTISPSSSPKPASASAVITNVSSTEVSVKATPILAPVPSQIALVTTPSVAPPKPCISPAAPVAVVGSQEAEQKQAEEPKQTDEELVIKESESQIQHDKPESEEANEIEEKLESEADIEKDSETREEKDSDTREEKDKENKKIEENVKVDTPKIDENPESVILDADPSTASNITSEGILKTATKSEETTENNTQKAAVKPKLYQRKNIHKSDNTAPETQATQKEQTSKAEKRKAPVVKEVANVEKTPKTPVMDMSDNSDERRGQRHRLKTILYQSPLPELAFIAKLSASEISVSPRNNDEKLTIFYKNEYLAVRNADGGFFLCQALQNVFKSSPRIRIRWMSEEKKDSNVYIPDFYDNTDIECVLTTVEMEKINKNSYRLPESEQGRIENILKKAIDVEKGVLPRPNVTEENPDGLDISLYKNESQIEKKTPAKKRKLNNSTKKSYSKSKSLKKKKRSKPRKEHDSSDSNADSEEETDDKEYKPSQKKNLVTQPKLRAQRSPLARARAASPITISKGLSPRSRKSVPQKTTNSGKNEENTDVSSPPTSRSDRAKRRTTETFLNKTEEDVPAKKPNLMPNQTKKAEAKTQIKTKTYKSDDELLVPMKTPPRISETWEDTESKSYSKYEINEILTKKTSKKGVTSMLATKKTKTTTTTPAEYATVVSATSQPATGGRATRSRK